MLRHVLAFALLVAPLAYGQVDPTSRAENQPVAPFKIVDRLYYVGASDVTSFLITTPKGNIVIDGGFVETAPQIERNIRTLGFQLSDVKILLFSHAHYDHVGGLAQLEHDTHAKLYASKGDAPMLASGGKDDPQFGDRLRFPKVDPDRIVSNGQRVTLGGITLTAHITPGHTPGCTTWTTRLQKLDIAFLCGPTVPDVYKLVGNPKYPGIIDDYRVQFAFLRSIHPDIFLGSHGSFFDLARKSAALRKHPKRNPFIEPEGYTKFVDEMEKKFKEMVAKQTAAAQ